MDRRKKILIVEDESLTAMALGYYLEDKGYEVFELLATGEEAVRIAKAKNPDLIFMDISLGGKMNGIEAAGIIGSDRRIPIVFLTGYSNQAIIEKAHSLNPLGYIFKPIDFSLVDEALSSLA